MKNIVRILALAVIIAVAASGCSGGPEKAIHSQDDYKGAIKTVDETSSD
jgi:hypothetical protein